MRTPQNHELIIYCERKRVRCMNEAKEARNWEAQRKYEADAIAWDKEKKRVEELAESMDVEQCLINVTKPIVVEPTSMARELLANDPLVYALLEEVRRQDEKHGPYKGTVLGRSRLALATLEDETAEALVAWRDEREAHLWTETRAEVLQVAATALRTLRDAL
jgi:hypothetical protein